MINRQRIEDVARHLQRDVYKSRSLMCKFDAHPLTMLRPEIAAEFLDFDYYTLESIPSDTFGMEVGGILDLPGHAMHISDKFKFQTRRFTAAHELGHILLHPQLAHGLAHRDMPISEMIFYKRPHIEQEADYFAACYLIPRKQLELEFFSRFGNSPIRLNETSAFRLGAKTVSDFFIEPSGGLKFASAASTTCTYGGYGFESLVQKFQVSVSAMSIRLKEVGLVAD